MTMLGLKLLHSRSGLTFLLSGSRVCLKQQVLRNGSGEHRSPTEHPESTFGRDSFQSGITPDPNLPPHTDLSNAGTGVIILPDEQLPSGYPETAEDWIKSAKKYGIPIEEYEPYPNDGFGAGDYPKFKPVHSFSRDSWYDWSMPPYNSDWGHVMHYEELDLVGDCEDIFTTPVIPAWKGYMKLFAQFFGFVGVCVFGIYYLPYHGWMGPKQYLHGWDPRRRRFYPEKDRPIYAFPEHPQHY